MFEKFFLLSFIFLSISCNDLNSNSFDQQVYGPSDRLDLRLDSNSNDDPQEQRFVKAQIIIQNSCTSCHFGFHASWSNLKTESAWVDSGLVVEGDALSSKLIQRMINYGGATSTMPIGAPAISDDDYESLISWINEMNIDQD